MGVYEEIAGRLESYSIDLKDFIPIDPETKKLAFKVKKTVLDGISFIAKNRSKLGVDKSIIGNHSLEAALSNAKSGNGLRAFAGQISTEDLNNIQLQWSFLATTGKGFREIFYFPDKIVPARDFKHRILLDQGRRMFDLRFGKMVDSPDVTSIHVDMTPGGETGIHLDKQGFVFADRNGKIYLSSTVGQHVFDELIWKDKILGYFGDGWIVTGLKRHVTIFSHLDHNSIADPTMGIGELQNNQFLRNSRIRAILGVGASYSINRLQLFGRASLGMNISKELHPKISGKDVSGVVGIRGTF